MNPGQNELNIIQFVEEIYCSVLRLQNICYRPVGSYEKEIIFPNSFGVLYAFSCLYENIAREYDRHVRDVVSVLQANPRCDYYVRQVGKYFYSNATFSWQHLRVFLSHMIAIASLAYKQGIVFLSDDLLITTATYLENHFKEDMKRAGGWPAFEQDCLLITMKMEGKGSASKSGNSSKQNTKKARVAPTLSNVLLVKESHYTAFRNQTFGSCHDAFDIQAYELDYIYTSCAHDYSKLHLFSLLNQDGSDTEGACILCNGASSASSKEIKVHNIIPKKECFLSTHMIMISVWTLNEMKRECPILDLSHIVA